EIIWSSVSATVKQDSRAGSLRSVTPRTTLVSKGSMADISLRGLLGVIDDLLGGSQGLPHGCEFVRVCRARFGNFAAPIGALAPHGCDLGQRLFANDDRRLVRQPIGLGEIAPVGCRERRQRHGVERVDAVDAVADCR